MSNIHFPAITSIKYNIAWHTKHSKPLLTPIIKPRLQTILRQTCDSNRVVIIGGVINPRYVHMMLESPPTHKPCDIVQWLKGRASRMLRQEFSELKESVPGTNIWNPGYICMTYGADVDDAIRDYIDSGGSMPVS